MKIQEIRSDLNLLLRHANKQIKELKYKVGSLTLYKAGKKEDEEFGIFARDSLMTSFLLKDPTLLKNILIFSIKLQGKKIDSRTGEEPGKIFHEYPEAKKRKLSTMYNASDTTALFLIGMSKYYKLSKDKNFIKKNKNAINLAFYYLLRHIKDGIFWEDPKFCHAKNFALKSTYWKDCGIPMRKENEPRYPVAYTLLQAQVIEALRNLLSLALLLSYKKKEKERLSSLITKMVSKLNKFWDKKENYFIVGIDKKGKISTISSDTLHVLYYLKKEDINGRISKEKIKILETPFGYRTCSSSKFNPSYGPNLMYLTIWPFEQAFIAEGALRHNYLNIVKVCLRTIKILKKFLFPELILYNKKPIPAGKKIQLWTLAYPKAMLGLLRKLKSN